MELIEGYFFLDEIYKPYEAFFFSQIIKAMKKTSIVASLLASASPFSVVLSPACLLILLLPDLTTPSFFDTHCQSSQPFAVSPVTASFLF